MFVHCVYFWLKPGLDAPSKEKFTRGLRSLIDIQTVRYGYFGVPADTDRAIIDRSYSYGLVCAFDSDEGHDAYQVHPVHDAFREECGEMWDQVRIFDFVGDSAGRD